VTNVKTRTPPSEGDSASLASRKICAIKKSAHTGCASTTRMLVTSVSMLSTVGGAVAMAMLS
jgi:hypothetical protein